MKVPLVTIGLAVSLLGGAGQLSADTVKLRDRPAFRNVTIADFRENLLVFRGVSGEVLRKPLAEVEWLAITECTHLTAAERVAATGNWNAALGAYDRALAGPSRPWLRNLVLVRLLAACEPAGRFDRAIELYLELLHGQPKLAAGRRPARPGPVGSDTNGKARRVLESQLAQDHLSPAVAAAARSLLLEVLIYEEVSPLPAQFAVPAVTEPASRPAIRIGIGILPPGPAAGAPDSRPSPVAVLGGDSLLIGAAERCLAAGEPERAARLIGRGLPYVPRSERWPWRLLLGRCRIAAAEYAEAAAGLLEVAETAPDRLVATTALYYAGVAHQRLGRKDVARRLYRELLNRDDTPASVKDRARVALAEVPL